MLCLNFSSFKQISDDFYLIDKWQLVELTSAIADFESCESSADVIDYSKLTVFKNWI